MISDPMHESSMFPNKRSKSASFHTLMDSSRTHGFGLILESHSQGWCVGAISCMIDCTPSWWLNSQSACSGLRTWHGWEGGEQYSSMAWRTENEVLVLRKAEQSCDRAEVILWKVSDRHSD